MNLPDAITHYHSQADRPFQNLCDLEPEELTEVLEKLKQRKADNPNYKRIFGKQYMDFRRRTEAKLRDLFEARGGKPERQSPHYFVLDECDWFPGLYPDPRTVKLDWRSLPKEALSFTYPDSFVSMQLGLITGCRLIPFNHTMGACSSWMNSRMLWRSTECQTATRMRSTKATDEGSRSTSKSRFGLMILWPNSYRGDVDRSRPYGSFLRISAAPAGRSERQLPALRAPPSGVLLRGA